ncbi:hypothetical protein PFBG_01147 [Plasmodium falciparum 7G8]|uniref:Uncharacterized protein n=1 Tax=Plasmodium falciparum (isolate 7G8) TaxID=57266 RepID=W7FHB1_PLAF8|nr:hypothetical protein PFBG_01147 [Plasmodium falciparum 7G8]
MTCSKCTFFNPFNYTYINDTTHIHRTCIRKTPLYSNIYTHLSCKNTTKIYMDVTYVLLKLKDLRDTLKDDEI